MEIALPGLWSLTPIGALLGMLVWLQWITSTGRYIPKASHERELAAANKRGDEWKETALETRTLNTELAKQNSDLTEANKTAAEFFGTVLRGGGGTSVAQTNTPST